MRWWVLLYSSIYKNFPWIDRVQLYVKNGFLSREVCDESFIRCSALNLFYYKNSESIPSEDYTTRLNGPIQADYYPDTDLFYLNYKIGGVDLTHEEYQRNEETYLWQHKVLKSLNQLD